MEPTPVKIVEKPWGREIWLCVENEYAGKILEITKGLRTSLQYHKKKKESIYVYKGRLKLEYLGGETIVEEGHTVTLNPRDSHRLVALEDLILLEVSTPEVEDVVRVEDDYGRN